MKSICELCSLHILYNKFSVRNKIYILRDTPHHTLLLSRRHYIDWYLSQVHVCVLKAGAVSGGLAPRLF